MLVRRATPADSDAIANIFQEAFGPFKSGYTPDAYASTAVGEDVILQRMNEGYSWIAIEDGTTLGTVSATPTWDGFYVTGMAVSPKAQGKRVAYLLMCALEETAQERGDKRVYLYTTPFLHRAINLYEKFGFTRYGSPGEQFMGTTLIQFEKYL